jgi:cytochrome c5
MFVSGFWHQALAASHEEKVNVEQLFESKCSLCHSIERPKSKKKSKEGWKTTVMRMKNKNGCPITDEEAQMIIDYLADKYGI